MGKKDETEGLDFEEEESTDIKDEFEHDSHQIESEKVDEKDAENNENVYEPLEEEHCDKSDDIQGEDNLEVSDDAEHLEKKLDSTDGSLLETENQDGEVATEIKTDEE